jgi:nicotinic acid mononucleotide adenylyltransferase
MARRGVFPGSFNPPTIAHVAIAEQARRQHHLDRIDLVVSRRALAKERVEHPRFEHRIEVLRRSVAGLDGMAVRVTEHQLLADIAEGYDLVIMGADKWWQIRQIEWYESPSHRDQALATLPPLAVVPRPGYEDPPHVTLDLDRADFGPVSSSRARDGEPELMTRAAREFARRTGAWVDVERYERWVADQCPDGDTGPD